MNDTFLPMTRRELEERGVIRLDYIVVTPDAYVDHPSFAAAIIGRFVESLGFRVGVISQPGWDSPDDFMKLGSPRYAFLLSGGNMDGIVSMYTAAKKPRSSDAYSPGGRAGLRPPRPTIAYTARLKQAYPGVPVIIGGVEASNRRFAHYDYYEDKVRRSYLVDSKADLLVYGMGEKPLEQIVKLLAEGKSAGEISGIRGTCVIRGTLDGISDYIELPPFESAAADKTEFAKACGIIHENMTQAGKTLVQKHADRYLVQFPPSRPLTTPQMDAIYELPFARREHPSYTEPVPALSEVRFGITSLRGCPGMCSFCSISAHQGKRVQKRSKRSIVKEAEGFAETPGFKGVISDVGGPTANFYDAACTAKNGDGCARSCLSPKICKNLRVSHKGLCGVLEALEGVRGVRKVFIRSGIRYDYLNADRDAKFIKRLVKKHVSGQLKVAPEHTSENVLRLMNKPPYKVYESFSKRFRALSAEAGRKQYLLPYYISSHPGSTLGDAIELALALKKQGFIPEQVQDFYPTPGTLSTCMYYTGINPLTGEEVYAARSPEEKAMQRALLQFNDRKNWPLIREALRKAGREDLIGNAKGCLVPEERESAAKPSRSRAGAKARRRAKKLSNRK